MGSVAGVPERSVVHSPTGHGTHHVALLIHARSSHGELSAATLDNRRTRDPEDGERVVAPVLADDDEFQVMCRRLTSIFHQRRAASARSGSRGP